MYDLTGAIALGYIPGPMELVLILGIALIIFGPGKLPEVGRSLGKTIREFKSETKKGEQGEAEDKPAAKEESRK